MISPTRLSGEVHVGLSTRIHDAHCSSPTKSDAERANERERERRVGGRRFHRGTLASPGEPSFQVELGRTTRRGDEGRRPTERNARHSIRSPRGHHRSVDKLPSPGEPRGRDLRTRHTSPKYLRFSHGTRLLSAPVWSSYPTDCCVV